MKRLEELPAPSPGSMVPGGLRGKFLFVLVLWLLLIPVLGWVREETINEDNVHTKGFRELGNYPLENVGDIVVREDLAFVSSGYRLEIFNITDPKNPTLLGSYLNESLWEPQIVLSGDRVLLYRALEDGLDIVDISDLTEPRQLASWGNQTEISSVVVFGELVVLSKRNHISILDVTKLSNPEILSELTTGGGRVEVLGNHLFTKFGKDLSIYDISDPRDPGLLSSYELDAYGDWRLSGDYLYYKFRGKEMIGILDVSNRSAPRVVGSFHLEGVFGLDKNIHIMDMELDGNLLYLCLYYDGLLVLNASKGSSLEVEGLFRFNLMSSYIRGRFYRVGVWNGTACLADGDEERYRDDYPNDRIILLEHDPGYQVYTEMAIQNFFVFSGLAVVLVALASVFVVFGNIFKPEKWKG